MMLGGGDPTESRGFTLWVHSVVISSWLDRSTTYRLAGTMHTPLVLKMRLGRYIGHIQVFFYFFVQSIHVNTRTPSRSPQDPERSECILVQFV
jgi:hypothetical protein